VCEVLGHGRRKLCGAISVCNEAPRRSYRENLKNKVCASHRPPHPSQYDLSRFSTPKAKLCEQHVVNISFGVDESSPFPNFTLPSFSHPVRGISSRKVLRSNSNRKRWKFFSKVEDSRRTIMKSDYAGSKHGGVNHANSLQVSRTLCCALCTSARVAVNLAALRDGCIDSNVSFHRPMKTSGVAITNYRSVTLSGAFHLLKNLAGTKFVSCRGGALPQRKGRVRHGNSLDRSRGVHLVASMHDS
jgi:hypothetical protein